MACSIDPALKIAEAWQRNFPLCARPFRAVGRRFDLTGEEVMRALAGLGDRGALSRIGAAVRPNTAGASTLAALAAPAGEFNRIVEIINAEPGVNHNYRREHELNLWFVVTDDDRAGVLATLDRISEKTGCEVLDLPLERAYHIDLGFPLDGKTRKDGVEAECFATVDDADRALLAAIEDGIPLVSRPYLEIAAGLGWREAEVIARLGDLVDRGIIKRFGCILRHRRVGYTANAMCVWDVPSDMVDAIAARLAARPEVTLCYRRTRRAPQWPYNLFAMIHGRERGAVRAMIAEAELASGLAGHDGAVLFSTHCYKQRGARFSGASRGAA